MSRIAAAVTALVFAFAPISPQAAVAAETASPALVMPVALRYKFANCTALNKVYPHGVGKSGAHDRTSGKPVTNFKHSTSLYKKIMKARKSLDRDKDGIACEKR